MALGAVLAALTCALVTSAPIAPATDPPAGIRVVAAPTRAPLAERLAARGCPELAPTQPGGAVRRVAARSSDEPELVTGLRRTCSALRSGVASLWEAAPPPGACAGTCPDALRHSVATAREHAVDTPAAPEPWTGGRTACTPPDPTGGDGCVTGATRHGLVVLAAAFGPLHDGPTIRSAGCWDAHAWNPHSDHPSGRACDLFPGTAGAMPHGDRLDAGWKVADYLRANAGPLDVAYLIWQGRYWDPSTKDQGGWGSPYRSSVYDTSDVTGGHYDHVHVSFR
ncbi:hypothetical protein GCM10009836_57510 [Pseudonocardia ailaonensis]|uniref:ARB-07466-like C-terminal domain-containing protein n=1 Tax=Pseudonocardia ailaonensis TaxID=367279 RepID=A0ABN2NHK8_9PSEU